jgi:hypothetical protein
MSSARVIKVTKDYIDKYGVPGYRKLHPLRRLKMNMVFGKKPGLL